MKTSFHPPNAGARQRGVVLMFCLVILVVLLAGGVAVMRSMNSSLFSAGNLAFKRDLLNQGELATAQVMKAFATGGALATSAATASNLPSSNYSAVQLKTNERGIPLVLLKKGSNPVDKDINGADFAPTGAVLAGRSNASGSSDVSIRYVIDRLCNATGTLAALGSSKCVYTPSTQPTGGTGERSADDIPPPVPALYRLTVRVDGPRDTQVFLQSSFSKPE